jgi:hypothetical protein
MCSWLEQGLKALGLIGARLELLPKGAPEKVALAWWLRRRTTVSLRWVSERLGMGHYTRVTQAVSRMDQKPGRKLRLLREALLAFGTPGIRGQMRKCHNSRPTLSK